MKNLLFLQILICILISNTAFSQRGYQILKADVESAKQVKKTKAPVSLFQNNTASKNDPLHSKLGEKWNNFPVIKINNRKLKSLFKNKPGLVNLKIPVGDLNRFSKTHQELELELVQFNVFDEAFTQIIMPSGKVQTIEDLNVGTTYRGIVKELDNAIAIVNVMENEMSVMMSSPEIGNIVVEKINDTANKYLVFEDEMVLKAMDFPCEYRYPPGPSFSPSASVGAVESVSGCFGVHFDIGNSIYSTRGSGSESYLQSIFSNVATLYYNEGINITISSTMVWTSLEPFIQNLDAYEQYRRSNPVNASFSHYVHNFGGGGLAYVNSYCSANNSYAIGMNGLEGLNASPVPAYSWPVYVISHELGHNFGSEHTHDCVWNGNNTPIDGCGSNANGCGLSNYLPPDGGTIMSYCHIQNVGVNFSKGFGQQPGDRMRYWANNNNGCKGFDCGGGGNPTVCDLTFSNTGCQTVDYYLNSNGNYTFYGTIQAGSSTVQNSNEGSLWEFRFGGNSTSTYTADCTGTGVNISSGGCGGGNPEPCTLTFNNTGCQPIDYYWNNNGSYTFYGTIQAGSYILQNSNKGTVWEFRINGSYFGELTSDCVTVNWNIDSEGCGGNPGICDLTINNTGCETLDYYWNNNGTYTFYGTIQAGFSAIQNSYEGTIWEFRVNGNPISTYTADCVNPNVNIDSGGCGNPNGCDLTINNTGCQAVDYYWNNGGTYTYYATIQAGSFVYQNSFAGTVWEFRVGGSPIGTYTSDCINLNVNVDAGGCNNPALCDLTFNNTGCQPVDYYWNSNGTYTYYGTIQAGSFVVQNSYEATVWEFRVNGSYIGDLTSDCVTVNWNIDSGGCGGQLASCDLTFYNIGCQAVDYYLYYNGYYNYYGTIQAGWYINQNTYVGEVWGFAIDGTLIGTYTTNCADVGVNVDTGGCSANTPGSNSGGIPNGNPCNESSFLYTANGIINQSAFAKSKIETNGKVPQGSTIIHRAVEYIQLNEGFEVEKGAAYEADTMPCD